MSKAIIFDLDGVILDTRKSNAEAFKFAFRKNNIPEPNDEDIIKLIGKTAEEMTSILLENSGVKPKKELISNISNDVNVKHVELIAKFAKLFDGVKEVLEDLNQEGYTILACTSGTRIEQEHALTYFGVIRYFDEIQTASDSNHKKPDPKFLQELIENKEFKKIFYIDDSLSGITMAKNYNKKIITIYASYGYGTPANSVADKKIKDIKELPELLSRY